MIESDCRFMELAIEQARLAPPSDVPVGAVIVRHGEVVATGYNARERKDNALLHAELVAIAGACAALSSWSLQGCTLYVTLEPCPMCAGAIAQARMERVVFGALDPKAGACGSVCDLFAMPFAHRPLVTSGVLERECAALLQEFFANLRKEGKTPCNFFPDKI